MTRDQALETLRLKTRPYKMGALFGIPATPVAVGALQLVAVAGGYAEVDGLLDFLPGQLFWTPVTWVILGISVFLLVRRANRITAALRPTIEAGDEVRGTIDSAHQSERKKGGVQMFAVTATMRTEDGRVLRASAEEPVGTPLPPATPGASAIAWIAGGAAVVSVGDGFLKGEVVG